MTLQATTADLQDRLASLLAEVEKGNEVVICKGNEPVAKLTRVSAMMNRSKAGREKGKIQVLGDITGAAISSDDWDMLKA